MNRADFREAFALHKDAIYRFAWRMTNSPEAAEDVAQEVFLALLRRPDGYDPLRGQLRGFLFGAARNQVRKRWREETRWSELDDEFTAPPMDIARGETASMVAEAVQSLAPLQREVLILSEYEDLSLEEIARMVDAEVGTVKSRLFRARENLRRALAPLREVKGTYGTVKR
ncbi:MAG: RNA polymerase sigma factor [Acidobacteriota bacterium]